VPRLKKNQCDNEPKHQSIEPGCQNFRSLETKSMPVGRNTPTDSYSNPRERQGGYVGYHMSRVGQQRQRIEYYATDNFRHHEQSRDKKSYGNPVLTVQEMLFCVIVAVHNCSYDNNLYQHFVFDFS
jgi:hypothetical protein